MFANVGSNEIGELASIYRTTNLNNSISRDIKIAHKSTDYVDYALSGGRLSSDNYFRALRLRGKLWKKE